MVHSRIKNSKLKAKVLTDLNLPQDLLEDGRPGEPEAEPGGEAGARAGGQGGEEELLRLLQLHLDPDVELQQDQRLPQLRPEDNQVVVRVETSHWSRSTEILCSDWLGS